LIIKRDVLLTVVLILLLLVLKPAIAEENELPQVTIADSFIEMHTGPSAGYPIFHVVDRGQKITIIRRRTNWFEIRTEQGRTGWADRDQMQQTLLPNGEKLTISDATKDDFVQRDWLFGATGGEFERAPILSIFTGYSFTKNISTELTLAKSVGNVSSSTIWKINLLMHPFPEASYSPYFTIGSGSIKVKPSATLIAPRLRSNSFSQVGIGLQHYLSRRFLIRLEFNEYVVFSANNDSDSNEELNEWKAGFAVFF
jgi:hypothetical protein